MGANGFGDAFDTGIKIDTRVTWWAWFLGGVSFFCGVVRWIVKKRRPKVCAFVFGESFMRLYCCAEKSYSSIYEA